ncbi:uncharacterized protein LOC124348791 [Daphnia pulicaria]|uniref:uncharacterized protein LOC124348791 n=1 Tax=Daphnia pulicaria TaxID=35523 RepID=UPI001EEB7E7B|nr:uncharacterized protein LOC124348791 [Daphnia pulicaria]
MEEKGSSIVKSRQLATVTSRTTIKDQSDKLWDSVFWREENYRPDRTTTTLNEIFDILDAETQKKLVDMFQKAETSINKYDKRRGEHLRRENSKSNENERRSQAMDQEVSSRNQTEKWELAIGLSQSTEQNRNAENKERIQHNYDSDSWADVDRISSAISGKMANDSDSSRWVEMWKEDVEKLLQESRNYVRWNGEKFVPKPMQLSKINLGKFRDSQSFQDRTVRVRYTNAELSVPIKFMEHAELVVTDEWNNMKDEIKATTALLKANVMNLVKTNTELGNVKNNLNDTSIYLTNKLDGTIQELEKTRANVNDLSTKLNTTEKEIKIMTGNLPTELKAITNQLKTTEDKLRNEL